MRDDYETGLQRGRSSRTILGKVRWILLALLLVNFFLIYKVWDQGAELSNLNTRNSDMQKNLVSSNLKQARTDKLYMDIKSEKYECDKLVSVAKAMAEDQKSSNQECKTQLIDANNKIKELSERFEQLHKEKENCDYLRETCVDDLNASKELVNDLKKDLAAAKQLENNSRMRSSQTETLNGDSNDEDEDEDDFGAKPPMDDEKEKLPPKIEEKVKSVKNITISDKVQTPVLNNIPENKIQTVRVKSITEEDEEIVNVDGIVLDTLAQCQFTLGADVRQNLCNFQGDGRIGKWHRGQSNIINNQVDFDQDQKDASYLYVDHASLPSGTTAGIIFSPVKSKQCIKVDMTVLSIKSGSLEIVDIESGQAFEYEQELDKDKKSITPGWNKASFLFKELPSYTIKLVGQTGSDGAIAVSDFFVTEAKCAEDEAIKIKAEMDEEEEEEEEERKRILIEEEQKDKEAIKELAEH